MAVSRKWKTRWTGQGAPAAVLDGSAGCCAKYAVASLQMSVSSDPVIPGMLHGHNTQRGRLVRHIMESHPGAAYGACPIDDDFGPAVLRDGVDVLVVRWETRHAGHTLNVMWAGRGLGAVDVAVVPIIYGRGGGPISTTLIREGMMDTEGNRREPNGSGPPGAAPSTRQCSPVRP